MAVLMREAYGRVTLLKLNRPEIGNALNEALIQELYLAIERESQNPDISALVITGAGTKFCTGADLKEMGQQRDKFKPALEKFFETLEILSQAPMLTASFVNGDCFGGGLGIALSTDYLLARAETRFGTPEVTKGLFPFLISNFLIKKIGPHATNTLCYGGRFLTSEEAASIGIPSEVCKEAFEKRAEELLKLWNSVPTDTLRSGKRVLKANGNLPKNDLIELLARSLKNIGEAK